MTLTVAAPAGLRDQVVTQLPPGWEPVGAGAPDIVLGRSGEDWTISVDGEIVGPTRDSDVALGALGAQIRAQVAVRAPGFIFIHAGAVALDGQAIILPGSSFAGKTRLVAALVRSGAAYLSDEFAVLDEHGCVHPYPKPLSLRQADGLAVESPPARFGASASRPVPVGLIAMTEYQAGSRFDPQPLSAGSAALQLLSHAVPAQTRPQQTMAFVRAAVMRARAWHTARDEAEETARLILSQLPWAPARSR